MIACETISQVVVTAILVVVVVVHGVVVVAVIVVVIVVMVVKLLLRSIIHFWLDEDLFYLFCGADLSRKIK